MLWFRFLWNQQGSIESCENLTSDPLSTSLVHLCYLNYYLEPFLFLFLKGTLYLLCCLALQLTATAHCRLTCLGAPCFVLDVIWTWTYPRPVAWWITKDATTLSTSIYLENWLTYVLPGMSLDDVCARRSVMIENQPKNAAHYSRYTFFEDPFFTHLKAGNLNRQLQGSSSVQPNEPNEQFVFGCLN